MHGSPLDEDEYLITRGRRATFLTTTWTQLTFFGHTHLQGGFLLAPRSVKKIDPGRPFCSWSRTTFI